MKILALDTSNQALAVALCEDEKVLGSYLINIKKNHSLTLMPAIAELVAAVNWQPQDIQRIVVAQGPGSYTGLRIGVTTAKTLAWTLAAELVGVSSLASIAGNCQGSSKILAPLFNARRENVYSGVYQWQAGELVELVPDQHVALSDWLEQLNVYGREILFVGNDVEFFAETIQAVYGDEMVICQNPQWNTPNAVTLAQLGSRQTAEADVAGFLPTYLKLVEAEEKWLATHQEKDQNYVEKI